LIDHLWRLCFWEIKENKSFVLRFLVAIIAAAAGI
jgi:hypothetical protein